MQQILFAAKVSQCLAPVLSSGDLKLEDLKLMTTNKKANGQDEIFKLIGSILPEIDTDKLFELANQAIIGNLFAGDKKMTDLESLNKHLEGNIKDSFQLMIWAVSVNVGVFFG